MPERGCHPNSLPNLRPNPRWRPAQSANPGGRPHDIDSARAQIRDFMLRGGGMEQWVALTRHRNPMVRVYVFRDLMRYGFGLPPQEIRVERHASTVNVHVAAVADPAKNAEVDEARAKVRSLLVGNGEPPHGGTDGEAGQGDTTNRRGEAGDDSGGDAG